MPRARVAITIAMLVLALPALVLYVPLATASSGAGGVSVSLANNTLVLSNSIVRVEFNLTWGASIVYYSLLGSTVYNCTNASIPPGFHVAAVKPGLGKPAEKSSLVEGPWTAEVLVNSTDRVVVRLEPSASAAEDVSPAELYVIVTLTSSAAAPIFHVHIENPSSSSVALASASLNGSPLGLELFFAACTGEPHTWEFYTLYSTPQGPTVTVFENPNGTSPSEFMPVNETFLGAANIRSDNGTPTMLEALETPAAIYYTAYKDATGALVIKAYTNITLLDPGSSVDIVARAGMLASDPALLAGLQAGTIMSVVNSSNYTRKLIDESNHYSIVRNLTTQISNLKKTLNDTRSQLDKCNKEKKNLTQKIGEFQELLDTCKVEKSILANRTAELKAKLDSSGVRMAIFSTITLIVGVAGGYIIREKKA